MVAKPLDFNNENGKYEERSCSRNSNNSNSNTICNGHFKRDPLPIDGFKKHIIEILGHLEDTVIFIGETASGKSTQIPQFCHNIGLSENGLIGVTQPRRVAARTLAERVAAEMCTKVGQLVGYKFRFENNSCTDTRILYQTEGILLREAQQDARLRRYSTIIVDEIHERTINMDVLLYILKQAQNDRKEKDEPPLRLILMSATMDLQKLQKYFHKAEAYYVRGRQHIVKLFNAPSLKANENDYLFNAISTVFQLHLTEPIDHGFLIFLTGQEEIETAINIIRKTKKNERSDEKKQYENIFAIPLYAAIPTNKQNLIFSPAPSGSRKVVFSTNIAETSITIPGIRLIIDSGKMKRRTFSPQNHMDVLEVVNISKAQAIQRAGRAGREAPGKCYRLYSQQDYEGFEPVQVPELLRSNISSVLLGLVNHGLSRLEQISKLIDPPSHDQLQSATYELLALNAIRLEQLGDHLTVNITEEGQNLVCFPVEPILAKIFLTASKLNCLEEACTVVAFLSVEHIFQNNNQDIFCKLETGKYGQEDSSNSFNTSLTSFSTNDGDHVRYVKIFRKYSTDKNAKKDKTFFQSIGLIENSMEVVILIRKQLIKICQNKKLSIRSCGSEFIYLRQAICKGLFQNACIYDQSSKNYILVKDRKTVVRIHPSSCLKNQKMTAFVFSELIKTNEIYARDICPIELDWIKESQEICLATNRELDRVKQLRLVTSPCSSISSNSSNSQRKGILPIKKIKTPTVTERENANQRRKVKIKEKRNNKLGNKQNNKNKGNGKELKEKDEEEINEEKDEEFISECNGTRSKISRQNRGVGKLVVQIKKDAIAPVDTAKQKFENNNRSKKRAEKRRRKEAKVKPLVSYEVTSGSESSKNEEEEIEEEEIESDS
ncbi:hypothetical protein ACQ4LE_007589 [Meloidogyne hapla]|uniref:RNA helicase n=1 Tax=Meloidogyne hapla TaxID=6305 RepID=A0A1I8B5E8_MELHA